MTATQTDIAADYRSLLDEIIATVDALSDEQWQAVTAPEGWSVGVVAHHIATVQQFMIHLLQGSVDGAAAPLEITLEQIHAGNAEHAREFAKVGKAETLEMLRSDAPRVVELIERLTSEQLDAGAMQVDGYPVTLSQSIDSVATGHFREHLASITETIQR